MLSVTVLVKRTVYVPTFDFKFVFTTIICGLEPTVIGAPEGIVHE